MDELKMKEGESKLAYTKRIVFGKLIDKTIDNDYSELAPLIFNKEYSSDVARRMFYGARNILELFDKESINNISDDDITKELDVKIEELKKERMKLQTTKLEYNRNIRKDSRRELLYENIKNTRDRLPLPEFYDIPTDEIEGSYFLLWTDLHYGAEFVSEKEVYNKIKDLNINYSQGYHFSEPKDSI
jgi:hypothetical protein